MANNRMSSGCSLIILIIIGLFYAYNYYVTGPENEKKEQEELIEKWGKSTVDYFSNFTCNTLEYSNSKHHMGNFMIIESELNSPCYLWYSFLESYIQRTDLLKNFYTHNIDDVNTIVWINTIKGEVYGSYDDGSNAIRRVAELNLIDKESNTIYKKIKVDYNGNPPPQIKRSKMHRGETVYFGKEPYEAIIQELKKEMNK